MSMPHGFFTIEQWKAPKRGAKKQWVAILHLNADQSLTKALRALQEIGKPGLYRVIQTQREVWAEMEEGKLRLRCWHASSPESLSRLAEAYERDGGRWPKKNPR